LKINICFQSKILKSCQKSVQACALALREDARRRGAIARQAVTGLRQQQLTPWVTFPIWGSPTS
jgi:hypothetical protein